jgi:rhamnosyltransferase
LEDAIGTTDSARAACAVVLRTLNEANGLREVLPALRDQRPVPPRLLAVDSGSTDDTLAILREFGVETIEITPDEFSYGRAINLGFERVTEPFAALLSAHAVPRSRYWLADLLVPMERDPEIVAVSGAINGEIPYVPGAKADVVLDSLERFRANPNVGLVNANALIRMSAWRERRFDEAMAFCEDKEWMVWALESGRRVCLTTGGDVWHVHEADGPCVLYRRGFREHREMTAFLPRPSLLRLAADVFGRPLVWFARGAWRWIGYVSWRLGQVHGRLAGRRRQDEGER